MAETFELCNYKHPDYLIERVEVDPHLREMRWLKNLVIVHTGDPNTRIIGLASTDYVENAKLGQLIRLQKACTVLHALQVSEGNGRINTNVRMLCVPFDGVSTPDLYIRHYNAALVVGEQDERGKQYHQLASMYASIVAPSPIDIPNLVQVPRNG